MSIKKFFINTKTWVTRPLYLQVPVVFLAFALMIFLSYRFMGNIERRHLLRDVDSAISTTQANIISELLEPETTLNIISEHIHVMILTGAGPDAVSNYIMNITDFMIADERLMAYATGAYGFFDVFGGKFCSGIGWVPPDDYVPESRPWYKAAVEADGKAGITDPYVDVSLGVTALTFARCIFDEEGNRLGIVCLDLMLDRIRDIAIHTFVTKGSYGVLLDRDYTVIAHPDPSFEGRMPRQMIEDPAIENELRQGKNISEYKTTDYNGNPCVLFIQQLENGWYMAVLAYSKEYYQSVTDIARILTVLGAILAVILSAILLQIIAEKLKSDERTQVIFDAMPLGASYCRKNKNGVMEAIDCNLESVRLFDLSGKQEYLNLFYALAPKNQPCGRPSDVMLAEYVNKAFEEGYCNFEWMHRKLNGELIPCEISFVRVKHHREFVVAGYTRDLRAHKALLNEINNKNDELKKLAHWYAAILDTIPFPISVTDAEMNWTFINKAAENFLGINRNDIIGIPCSNWKANICGTDNCGIARVKRGLKKTYFTHEDASFQVDTEILTDLDDNTAGFIEIVQNITKLEQITKRQIEAETASRAKSDFLARVSHEIRTPMNAILGITEIQLQNEKLSPDSQEAFDKIYHSGYLLLGIINDILDLSKIEAGKLELMSVQYDVPSLINDTVQLNTARYDSKLLNFSLEVDEDIPTTLFGDELRIKQILNNLLSNAFKYTDKGEISLSVTCEPAEPESGEEKKNVTIVFRVVDTGRGMTHEQVDKLFDEYTRFTTEANRTTIGTGLGMTITRHLVQMMNGDIFVESELGKGSVFTVRLPQEVVGSGVLGRELTESLRGFHLNKRPRLKKAPQIVRDFMPYGKVLVVDDVETNLYVARGLFAPYGLSIETASSGFEAIDKIRNGSSYDIIFMDHFMPIMDGIEAAKNIRSLGYEQSIIALTANALSGQAEMFLENGFNGFIPKPIDIRQLNATLNRLIRDKYPPDVVAAARRLKNDLKKNPAERTLPPVGPQIAEIFIRDAQKAVTLLENIYSNNFRRVDDIPNYVISVHSMKSALANIGETELSGAALELEQAGREGKIAVMTDDTPVFLDALRAVIEKMTPKENEDGEITEEDADKARLYLLEKLAVIQTACAAYNKKDAKDALAELRKKPWPRTTREALDAIAERLLHSEFEEAADIAGTQISS